MNSKLILKFLFMKRLLTIFSFTLIATMGLNAQSALQFFVDAPAGIAGQYEVGPPADDFGGALTTGQVQTGVLARAFALNDDPTVCTEVINAAEVAGKVALIDRGGCFFSDKVYWAEQAGAIAAIICNNQPNAGVINMGSGGDYAGLATIPSGFLSLEDCEEIKAEMVNGDVQIRLQVPAMYRPITNSAYATPVEHSVDLATLGVQVVNATTETIEGAEVYMDMTSPSGEVISSVANIDVFESTVDSLVLFEIDYVPSEVGQYKIEYTNNYNTDFQITYFEITDDKIFSTSRPEVSTSASNQGSWETGYKYWYASLYQPASDEMNVATHISFGIGNGDTLVTYNGASFNNVTAYLYDNDNDDDGNPDFAWSQGADYQTGLPNILGFGQYNIVGGETADNIIVVSLDNLNEPSQPVLLENGGLYYAAVEYTGSAAGAPRTPAFSASPGVDYGYPSTTLLGLGTELFTGWGTVTCVTRLHVDNTIDNTSNLDKLTEDQAKAFPNPSNGIINLELNLSEMADEVRLDVINYDGKVVETLFVNNVKEQTIELNITDQPNGYYFVSVKTPEGYRSIPVMVAN